MTDITKISKLSVDARSKMPFEMLVRAFYRAKASSKATESSKAPASVREVVADNLKGYEEEISRRCAAFADEETLNVIKKSARWNGQVQKIASSLKQGGNLSK